MWLECLIVGAAGGLLAGMLGVGGGIIMIPLLMLLLKLPIHDAKATSLAIIVFTGVAGTIEHQRQGRIDWQVVIIASLAAMVFSPLGAYWSKFIPRESLLRLFAILLIVTGIKYLMPSKPKPAAAEVPPAAAVVEPARAAQG